MDSKVFEDLMAVSVNGHTEKKKSGSHKNEATGKWEDTYLTYLSWPYAWAETKKRYPEASYTIWKDDAGRPYTFDQNTGFMVYTSVTIEGVTHEMWLPVMDGANKAMKAEAYEYQTKNGVKSVEAATMFDINKTIMRCLVKNLAMFGLGLYIYAGEDLPEDMAEAPKEAPKSEQKAAIEGAELRAKVIGYINRHKYTADQIKQIASKYGKMSLNELTVTDCQSYISFIKSKGGNIDE